jgi:hypothetical protein
MTKDEALKLALEALEFANVNYWWGSSNIEKAITAIKSALEAKDEPDAYGYAKRLAEAIWSKHYKTIAPQWEPFDELIGVLTQIDNMTAGLISPPHKEAKDEPCCYGGIAHDCHAGSGCKIAERLKTALEANEFNPDWDTQAVLAEEIQRMAKRIEELEAKDEPVEFFDWYDNAHWGNEDFKEGCHRAWNAAIKYTAKTNQEAKDEPVAWMYEVNHAHTCLDLFEPPDDAYDEGTLYPLYLAPPQRKPLTDEEIDTIGATIFKAEFLDDTEVKSNRELARAIEAAHGIKGEA